MIELVLRPEVSTTKRPLEFRQSSKPSCLTETVRLKIETSFASHDLVKKVKYRDKKFLELYAYFSMSQTLHLFPISPTDEVARTFFH